MQRPRLPPSRAVLSGPYVTLAPLSVAHAGDLWPFAEAAPASFRWLPNAHFADAASFEAYIRLMEASRAEMLWAVLPSLPDGQGRAAGWLALLDIESRHARCELGNIWFPPGLSRTRAATAALSLILSYAFDTLGYRRVAWKCDSRHTASRAAAERLGFSYEGILRAHMIVKGEERDTVYYALLDDAWPARRAALQDWLKPENFDADGRARRALVRAP